QQARGVRRLAWPATPDDPAGSSTIASVPPGWTCSGGCSRAFLLSDLWSTRLAVRGSPVYPTLWKSRRLSMPRSASRRPPTHEFVGSLGPLVLTHVLITHDSRNGLCFDDRAEDCFGNRFGGKCADGTVVGLDSRCSG